MENFITSKGLANRFGLTITEVEEAVNNGLLPRPIEQGIGQHGWPLSELAGLLALCRRLVKHRIERDLQC